MNESPPRSVATFARLVQDTSDEELRAAVAEHRDEVLDGLFAAIQMLATPEGMKGVVEWQISGREGGDVDRFVVAIDGGGCKTSRGGARSPALVVTVRALDLVRMATGGPRPFTLYTRGRLRLRGDMRMARQLDDWFRNLGS